MYISTATVVWAAATLMRSTMSALPGPGAGPRQVKGKCAASFICVLITRAARSCEHGARRAGVASTEIIFLSWGGSQDGFINPSQISFPLDRGRGLTAGALQLWHRCTSAFTPTIYYFIICKTFTDHLGIMGIYRCCEYCKYWWTSYWCQNGRTLLTANWELEGM